MGEMVYYRGLSNMYNDKLEEIKISLSKRDFEYPYLSEIFNSDEYLFKRQYGMFLEPSFRTKWFVLNTLRISFNEDDTYEFETPIDLGYTKSDKNYLSIILKIFVEIHKQLSNDNYIYIFGSSFSLDYSGVPLNEILNNEKIIICEDLNDFCVTNNYDHDLVGNAVVYKHNCDISIST